ncbi:PH domain-containing protein [Streptomyces cavernae]|uniref:PH domain-containing protein n=1 Tax=Streptomyces cavernae TaxID=2259034 RepID=UPI000FEC1933|nr:PH domain-containing protein [Streptomyces cavernae]
MTTPDPQPPPSDSSSSPSSPASSSSSQTASRDRIYRSPAGIAGGVLLLGLVGWLGIDALVAGDGRVPWLALAAMLLMVPLITAFTLRPAVFANEDRLRIRNPFRVVELPWATVESFRSGYSNEVLDTAGAKYQLWAIPVSLRARKKATRRQNRAEADGMAPADGPIRAQADQIMDELGELKESRAAAPTSQGEPTVRWAYEVAAPAVAGAVLLVILIATG